MKGLLFSFLLLTSAACTEATTKAPVKTTQVSPAVRQRTPQEETQLKEWIVGIQKLAESAQTDADNAEKEAAKSRAELETANENADNLQQAIEAQAKELNTAIADKNKAVEHDAKVTKENNFLKNILGGEAAIIALLLCLWLNVPRLYPPYGLIAAYVIPVIVFGFIKLIL